MVLAVVLMSGLQAQAQWGYPGGYRSYGWGGWGMNSNPNATYMAGLGAFARGKGAYEVDDAKARSVNVDTMIKWNKALRARQAELAAEQARDDARRAADSAIRVDARHVTDGSTLNALLMQIFEFDPAVTRASQSRTALTAKAIKEIPFEWDTDAITICIDQMTGKDSLPDCLTRDNFVPERSALRTAISAALAEEKKGNVSADTTKKLQSAINDFRARFVKQVPEFDATYNDALDYFSTMASLSRMLNDPSMSKILNDLDNAKETSIGELVVFMQSYNLKFAPAKSDNQMAIYQNLVPLLTQVAADLKARTPSPKQPDASANLRGAAKDAFKSMDWKHLDAQQSKAP